MTFKWFIIKPQIEVHTCPIFNRTEPAVRRCPPPTPIRPPSPPLPVETCPTSLRRTTV